MGLDNYWIKPGESKSEPLYFDPPLSFEDDYDNQLRREGWAYFPGRAWRVVIKQITEVSLHSKRLDNATIRRMAERLEAYAARPWRLPPTPPNLHRKGWEFVSEEWFRDLARLFRAYGDAGYEMSGDW